MCVYACDEAVLGKRHCVMCCEKIQPCAHTSGDINPSECMSVQVVSCVGCRGTATIIQASTG